LSCCQRCSQPMQSVAEKCCDTHIDIVPESSSRNPDEISPPITAQGERHRGDIHPCLKKVQPANVRFDVGRQRQNENEHGGPTYDEQLRAAPRMRRCSCLQVLLYDKVQGMVPRHLGRPKRALVIYAIGR